MLGIFISWGSEIGFLLFILKILYHFGPIWYIVNICRYQGMPKRPMAFCVGIWAISVGSTCWAVLLSFSAIFSFLCLNPFLPFFQRAWLLKLLALELHAGDMTGSAHREACLSILGHMFGQDIREFGSEFNILNPSIFPANVDHPGIKAINKSKVLFEKLLSIGTCSKRCSK